MPKYRYVKLIVFVVGLLCAIGGTIASAAIIRTDADIVDFTIDSATVKKYGYFDAISDTKLTGTILKPKDDLDPSVKRPCVFTFHGMFMNRFLQMQTAEYFVKAGMYVVMLDDPGQGESKGCYRLGYELEAIGQTVVDYFIDEGFEKYEMNVDLDSLGCNGHSYGGITSTFAGINKYDKLKAIASIWTWSELKQTVIDIMLGLDPNDPDFEDLIKSPIYRTITALTSFGEALYYDRNGDYSTDPEDIEKTLDDRNSIDRVNFTETKPPNWLLVTAYGDELTTPEQQIELMTMASWNASGGISFDDWKSEIEDAIDKDDEWSNLDDDVNESYVGNFGEKTARSLYLPKDTKPFGHMMEGFSVSAYVRILEWFGEAFDWDVKEIVEELEATGIDTKSTNSVDGPLPLEAILKAGSWGIAVLGALLILPATLSYLVRRIKFRNSEEEYQNFINAVDDNACTLSRVMNWKLIGAILAVYVLIESFSILIPLGLGITPKLIGIPYIIADAIALVLIGRFLIIIPFMVVIMGLLFKKNPDFSIESCGVPLKKSVQIKDITMAILLVLTFFVAFNLIGVISVAPRLIPRESPSMGYLGYVLLATYLLIFAVFDEIIFRGVVQTKIHAWVYGKLKIKLFFLKKWIEFVLACGIQLGAFLIGLIMGVTVITGGVPSVLVLGFMLGGFSALFISAFMSTYIYQRTRNIVPCVIASALVITILLGGSLIGAVMF